MIIKGVGGSPRGATAEQRKVASVTRARDTVRYVAQIKKGDALAPIHTNTAGARPEDIIKEMEAIKTLRPGVTDPVRHVVLSPERSDRALTKHEWQQAIDIYRKERGLGSAPFAAYLHTDGHDQRHAHHVHLVFLRTRPDGTLVPDALDAKVHFAASREIEKQLGLDANVGKMFSGRSKHGDRERQGEHQNVDPQRVQRAIAKSHDVRSLRAALKEEGIDVRFRRRGPDDAVYAWSLKNHDAKYWTAGSKLSPDNAFAWAPVQAQIDKRLPPQWNGKRHGAWKKHKGGVSLPSHVPRQRRADMDAQEKMADAISLLTETLSATRRRATVRKAVRTQTTRYRG